MHLARVCNPSYLDEFELRGAVPQRNPACPSIPPTGEPDTKLTQLILKLDANAGFDVRRYWTHSVLEDDWNALPDVLAEAFEAEVDPDQPLLNTASWNPKQQRKTLFRGIVFLHFRRDTVRLPPSIRANRAGKLKFISLPHSAQPTRRPSNSAAGASTRATSSSLSLRPRRSSTGSSSSSARSASMTPMRA